MTQDAYTIDEFCRAHGFSRGTYYNLKRKGLAPREMHLGGHIVRITREAAAEWRREREAETASRASEKEAA